MVDAHAPRAQDVLARADIFRGIETGTATALIGQLQLVEFPCGHAVYAEGDQSDRLFIIISGKVKIGRRSRERREKLLTIMGASDMFGELSSSA
jgi:CRP/FNR family cyclic AMP-dependent transcriptional regulator